MISQRKTWIAATCALVFSLSQVGLAADGDGNKEGAFDGGAEVNLNLSNGNVDIRTIGGALDAGLRTDRFTTRARASYLNNKTEGAERARQIMGNLRTGTNLANNID